MFISLYPATLGIKMGFPQTIEMAKRYGYGGIDFSIQEAKTIADERGVDFVKGSIEEAGLKVGYWGIPVDWRGEDEAKYRDGLAKLPDYAALSEKLGGTRAAVVMMPGSDSRPYDANFEWHVKRFGEMAGILRDHGVRFGIEFIGTLEVRAPRRYQFIHTMAGTLELAKAVGTGNVGLMLDSYHWYCSRSTQAELEQLTNADVVVVHVNDALPGYAIDDLPDLSRVLPMETGIIDLASFMKAMAKIGYDGPVIAEPINAELARLPVDEACRKSMESMQKMWQAAGLSV